MNETTCAVWVRRRVVVNTDPQRRCYDGCNFSERAEWSPWELVAPYTCRADAESSAATFRELNPARQYKVRPA